MWYTPNPFPRPEQAEQRRRFSALRSSPQARQISSSSSSSSSSSLSSSSSSYLVAPGTIRAAVSFGRNVAKAFCSPIFLRSEWRPRSAWTRQSVAFFEQNCVRKELLQIRLLFPMLQGPRMMLGLGGGYDCVSVSKHECTTETRDERIRKIKDSCLTRKSR